MATTTTMREALLPLLLLLPVLIALLLHQLLAQVGPAPLKATKPCTSIDMCIDI